MSLREKLERGGPAIGLWASLPGALTAEAVALAGPDYVRRRPAARRARPGMLMAMLQAIAGAGSVPLVRVAANDPFAIGQALDLGAAGVIVPMVSSGEEAAARSPRAATSPRGSARSARCAPGRGSGRCAW